jgi:DNA-binding transcriptional ArsR family regulator
MNIMKSKKSMESFPAEELDRADRERHGGPLIALRRTGRRAVIAARVEAMLTIHKPSLIHSGMRDADAARDRIFRALADPSRRAIFESLTQGEAAVKELTARFDISQPAVSQHLAALYGAGLVKRRREGRIVYYSVDPAALDPLIDWVTHYRVFWTDRIGRPERLLEATDDEQC